MTKPRTTEQSRDYKRAYRARIRALKALEPPPPPPPPGLIPTPTKAAAGLRPFVAIDGEGWGRNRLRQQHYMLLRIGDRELFTGLPLTTMQCFEFILAEPERSIITGFGIGYDATMILRSMSDDPDREHALERCQRLFQPRSSMGSHYTYWNQYGIEYLPGQFLRICRLTRVRVRNKKTGLDEIRVKSVPGSVRTIYEGIGFFQCGFVNALKLYGVGEQYWPELMRMKKKRENFSDRDIERVRKYNAIEVELHRELMEQLRIACYGAGVKPMVGRHESWNGPGKLAAFLHKQHGTMTSKEVYACVPPEVLDMSDFAFFGGRFEVPWHGRIDGLIYEYDINSAYPFAMMKLPCLRCGTWIKQNSAQLAKGIGRGWYIARVKFSHPPGTILGGLPVRTKGGYISSPLSGQGMYWSCEIEAAMRSGTIIEFVEGYRLEVNCSCQPYAWIEDLYQQRLALGKDKRGLPLKYAWNSLYGKLCQRVGRPQYGNMVHAGMITALTRAALLDAAFGHHRDILMLATDGIFSRVPLPLDVGTGLGQWEHSVHEQLFIVQPGLYWGAKRPKIRGIPSDHFFEKYKARFEKKWDAWIAHMLDGKRRMPPSVRIQLKLFVGLKLATHRKKLHFAGRWMKVGEGNAPDDKAKGKEFSFVWMRKRSMAGFIIQGQSVASLPLDGDSTVLSRRSRGEPDADGRNAELDVPRMAYEEQPDHIELKSKI